MMLTKLPDGFGIVIIDMQNPFFPGITKEKRSVMVDSQLELLDSAARNDFPAILIEYSGYTPTFPEIKEGVERVPRNEFVRKPYTDGFVGTDLAKKLNGFGINCMGLCGISAKVCVQYTANGAPEEMTFLTTQTTMADPIMAESQGEYMPTKNHIYLSTIDWFERNGVACFENHRDLLRLMEQK